MDRYHYLIVGGGAAAGAAARAIREIDRPGTLAILGDEPHPPYNRALLARGLWRGGRLSLADQAKAPRDLTLLSGRRAIALDPDVRVVTDDRGDRHRYDELLLATGGTPRRLDFGGDDILYLRTVDQYRRLRRLADRRGVLLGDYFLVLGGGFIGSELTAALATEGKRATLLFPEDGIGQGVFPRELAEHLVEVYRDRGVEVVPRDVAVALEGGGERLIVRTAAGRFFDPEIVVAGLGIVPNVELARAGGLAVDDGILVDEHLRTSAPHVWAAGDVANVPTPLGRRRVEHVDAALAMGRTAGRAMAGEPEPYRRLPSFSSDLFDLHFQAVGEVDARLETHAEWERPFREGVIRYFREGRLRGVLLVNRPGRLEDARRQLERSAAGAPLEEPAAP